LWLERVRFDFRQARASILLQHVHNDSSWLLFCCPMSGDFSCPVVPRLKKGSYTPIPTYVFIA
jgi:hypothetical protein